jgi:Protein of unknown function (DUF2380)
VSAGQLHAVTQKRLTNVRDERLSFDGSPRPCLQRHRRDTAADEGLPRVAFFGFQLINTSPQPTTPEETQRIRMLDDMFQQKLEASSRFKMVSIPPELRDKIAAAPEISNCNGCERDFALEAGADWAAWGDRAESQQPHSEHQCLYMEDARAKKMEFVKSVDIRGNTDESWQRGLDYMLRHYLFEEP